jgi:hypothetical protein
VFCPHFIPFVLENSPPFRQSALAVSHSFSFQRMLPFPSISARPHFIPFRFREFSAKQSAELPILQNYADSFALPFLRLFDKTFLPDFVFILFLNP